MPAPKEYPEEFKDRAIRLVEQVLADPDAEVSITAACSRVGQQLGINRREAEDRSMVINLTNLVSVCVQDRWHYERVGPVTSDAGPGGEPRDRRRRRVRRRFGWV